jgi:hypothetical protein
LAEWNSIALFLLHGSIHIIFSLSCVFTRTTLYYKKLIQREAPFFRLSYFVSVTL